MYCLTTIAFQRCIDMTLTYAGLPERRYSDKSSKKRPTDLRYASAVPNDPTACSFLDKMDARTRYTRHGPSIGRILSTLVGDSSGLMYTAAESDSIRQAISQSTADLNRAERKKAKLVLKQYERNFKRHKPPVSKGGTSQLVPLPENGTWNRTYNGDTPSRAYNSWLDSHQQTRSTRSTVRPSVGQRILDRHHCGGQRCTDSWPHGNLGRCMTDPFITASG